MRADFITIETADGRLTTTGYINDTVAFGAAVVAAQANPAMVRVIVANRTPVRVFHQKGPRLAKVASAPVKKSSRSKS